MNNSIRLTNLTTGVEETRGERKKATTTEHNVAASLPAPITTCLECVLSTFFLTSLLSSLTFFFLTVSQYLYSFSFITACSQTFKTLTARKCLAY